MMKISREEARAIGAHSFFTGLPCRRGNISERRTCNGECLCSDCRNASKERLARYRSQNRALLRQKASRYYNENKEEIEERRREYVSKNREKVSAIKLRCSRNKPEKYRKIRRKWEQNNKEKIRASRMKWRKNNAEKLRQIDSIRRSRKTNRKPAWFGELDHFVIAEAYSLAIEREAATGLRHEVDHLIPLISKKASGLHVADNIQVIPAQLNRRKGNRLIMTAPFEWLKFCQTGVEASRTAA